MHPLSGIRVIPSRSTVGVVRYATGRTEPGARVIGALVRDWCVVDYALGAERRVWRACNCEQPRRQVPE